MPPVDEWASDASYPPATSVGVDQSTKIEPSSGAKAQGFIPGQKFPVQRLNWILNALCVLGNANEADIADVADDLATLGDVLAARSLQAAYARSIALGQTTPHIDVGTGSLHIGGTANAQLLVIDNATAQAVIRTLTVLLNTAIGGDFTVNGETTLNGALSVVDDADVSGTLTLGNVNKLLITGAGPSGVPHALIQTSGVGGQVALDSGLYTPTVSAVTGTGVSAGDFTNIAGNFIRVGKTFHFSLDFRVNTTGWGGGGSGTVSFTLPVAGTVDGYVRGTVSMVEPMDGKFTTLTLARSASPTVVQLLMIKDTTYDNYMSVSGTLTLQ